MRHAFALLGLLSLSPLIAQDTTVISTLTFDSITTRRGWWQFPPETEQYRKVLMVHTLKCDPQTTQDQYDCGEWDYLTYHFVHEHTGVNDSTALTHPYFLVGSAAPASVVSSNVVPFNVHQRWQRRATVVSASNVTLSTVGINDTADTNTFLGLTRRSQYLYTAAELIGAGLVAGPVHELRFHPMGSDAALNVRCVIRMKNTTASGLSRFDDQALTTVFDAGLNFDTLSLVLIEPFTWDGTSNVLIDIAQEGSDDLLPIAVEASQTAGLSVQELGADEAIATNNDFVGVEPGALAALSDQVTITFRAFGAPELPLNTTFLEAVGASGQRILNIHLPWSNGRIYWDAGSDGAGYDRMDKAATTAEIEGQWNDWAFVKNATTGQMKIYLNGVQWYAVSGRTKPLNGIVRMRLASDANGGNPYAGMIDGLNIFSTELSATTIAEWHDRKTTSSHPDIASLLYSFEMDEGAYPGLPSVANAVDANGDGWLMGTVQRIPRPATALFRAPVDPGVRPVVTFVQGDQELAVDSLLTTLPLADFLPQLSRQIFAVQGNGVVPVDTAFAYSAGWAYTYDPEGLAIDSVLHGDTTHVNDTLHYFSVPYEVINNHEIGRYITPYGIGLDLGDDGFSWVYDVTDYQFLLHDSVEISAGNQQELIDLKFLMIEGTPPRPVVNMQWPWGSMRSYSYASMSDNTRLDATTLDLHPGASQWMMRSRLTGHGDATSNPNVQGCCEFKDNTHTLLANASQVDTWQIWRNNDCAHNPVYPQGGTWVYAREGWCPGDVVRDRETELTPYVQGDQLTLDYGITPVPNNNPGMGGGNYMVSMELVEYGPAAHQRDAELYDVLSPSDDRYRSRENPICHDPVVVMRNAGAQPLTSVTFSYRVSGGQPFQHTWTGNLAHMQRLDVELPVTDGVFWAGDSLHNFLVDIIDVNGGGADDYNDNDAYRTHFTMPVIYPENFVVFYKTNARPQENDLFIRDMSGNVVFSRTTFTANTAYRDTLELPPGCYELEFTDSGNDGLTFWAEPNAGSGYFRFRSLGGQTLRNFGSDFGGRIYAAFGIGTITSLHEAEAPAAVLTAMPNPTTGHVRLTGDGFEGPAMIEVLDGTGRWMHSERITATDGRTFDIDLGDAPAGLYLIRVTDERTSAVVRVLKQ